MSRGGDFWARRKAAVEAEAAQDARARETEQIETERAALEEKSDEEILAELNLPDPDALKPGDDIRGFMSQAVPDRLRRRALRTLWRLNPVLANVDGLVDYGEDFTDAALVIENLQTTYQVGKGMLAHVEEMARQAEEAAAAEDDPVAEAEAEVDAPLALAEDNSSTSEVEQEAPTMQVQHEPDSDAPTETQQNQSDTRYAAAPKRRMRFAFE